MYIYYVTSQTQLLVKKNNWYDIISININSVCFFIICVHYIKSGKHV